MIVNQSMLSDQDAQLGSIEGSINDIITASQGVEAGSVGMTAQMAAQCSRNNITTSFCYPCNRLPTQTPLRWQAGR